MLCFSDLPAGMVCIHSFIYVLRSKFKYKTKMHSFQKLNLGPNTSLFLSIDLKPLFCFMYGSLHGLYS